MDLEGQATPSRTVKHEGFALAALLVAIAILSVVMLVALPAWRHQAQREKETELIFRGEQYARAIALYQRKLAGAFPPSLDVLVEQKFIRKKYKDPITGEDFVPVYANSTAGMSALQQEPQGQGGVPLSGAPLGGRSTAQGQPDPGRGGQAVRPDGRPAASGPSAGIVGVMSKSKAQSIRLYNGRDRYDQWIFTYMSGATQAGQAAAPGRGRGGQ